MTAPLTGAQRCAVLLLVLDDAQAAEMLRRMSPEDVQAVGQAMLTVAEIAPETIDAVLDDVLDRSRRVTALDADGREARARISSALGSPRSAGVLDRLGPPAARTRFPMLGWLAPATVAAALADEHPQALAVVLGHLEPSRAAAVLDAFPDALRADLATRLATLRPVSLAAIDALEADVEACLAALDGRQERATVAGTGFAATLVRHSRHKAQLLAALGGADAGLAAAIDELQFGFADLVTLSGRDLQQVLREVAPDTLALAMKGADEAVKALIYGSMSKRAAAQLADDVAARSAAKRADVRTAQAEICRQVRAMGAAGTITLPEPEDAGG